ncbi:diacylglycerol kinase family protein [Sphingomonas sp. ASV193]|uniref:diacylglycerol/lipid kinase family protein n=1 Tax=Sphingomonas sp. ASV193 TaxID=3144405 RepID=UPI0032E87A57
MKAIILINRGGGSAGDDAKDKVAAALKKVGITGKVELLDGEGVVKRATAAARAKAPLVIAGGGDGTISAAAGALAGSETRLGLLPLGTLNHLARDLGIPFDLDQAARIIADGNTSEIDVAELNGRTFVNNSAVGLYPLMVLDRESQQQKLGRSKKLAMLVASLRTLSRFRHQRLSLTINDGEKAVIETPLLFVGNNDYRLSFPYAGQRETLDDGKLCVMVLRKNGRLGLFAAMARALVGRARDNDMIRLDDVQRLKVTGHRKHLTVSLDGETCVFACPLDYRIRPGALTVLAPRAGANAARA